MQRAMKAVATALVLIMAATVFVACGGGGGGNGGGGGGGDFLQISSEPSYGVMGTVNTITAFNLTNPSANSLVGPNDFPSAPAGDANYLQFQFNTGVLAASVVGSGAAGTAGIVVRNSAGQQISFFMDDTGAIDASNAFPAPGEAPATLRLYFQNAATPGVPIALPADKYSVAIIPGNLKSAAGKSFCVVKNSGLCINDTNCVFHFTLDGQNSPGGNVGLTSGPTVALPLPSIVQIDDEIRLFFSDHVDFQSIVGFNAGNGRVNTTTLDPFVSLPFQMNAVGAAGANIQVTFSQPAPAQLPPNYGYIVYMPNPFRDPSEVRIRFVDITALTGVDDPTGATTGSPIFQNYALDPAVWSSARLGANALSAPRDSNPSSPTFNQPLRLPAKLSLPGSNATNGTNSLAVLLFSSANAGASDSSQSNPGGPDGILGVTDRARRALAQDIIVARTMGQGPVFANNPEVPDFHMMMNGSSIDGIDTAGVTIDGQAASTLTGAIFRIAQPLADTNTLESVRDISFGAFVNFTSGTNSVQNPPRRLNHASVLAIKQLPQNVNNPSVPSPGVPFPPGGTPESNLLAPMMVPPPNQPLGIMTYVVDDVRGRVQVINSNNFQPITTLAGISSPRGLGRAGSFLYVSNFDQATLTRVGINPFQVQSFHQVVGTAAVGPGPTAVSVQPGNEDVFVINSLANSISIVDVPAFAQRGQLPVGQGSREVAVTPRWIGQGLPLSFQAYITNQFDNTVTCYESDTPLISEQAGPFGKILQAFPGFSSPLYGCYNYFVGATNGIGASGMLVPNSAGTTVTYMGWVAFGLGPTPGIPGTPSFRTFAPVIDYASNSPTAPTDATIEAFTYVNTNPNTQRILLAVYPAAGQVASIDFNTGAYYGGATVPGTQIVGFLDQ